MISCLLPVSIYSIANVNFLRGNENVKDKELVVPAKGKISWHWDKQSVYCMAHSFMTSWKPITRAETQSDYYSSSNPSTELSASCVFYNATQYGKCITLQTDWDIVDRMSTFRSYLAYRNLLAHEISCPGGYGLVGFNGASRQNNDQYQFQFQYSCCEGVVVHAQNVNIFERSQMKTEQHTSAFPLFGV